MSQYNRKLSNPNEFRNNIGNKFGKILLNDKLGTDLEKGIYDYCLECAENKNIVKKWDNANFLNLYLEKTKNIFINLKNPELYKKIIKKDFEIHLLAFMSHQELMPNKWKKLIDQKKIKDENLYAPKIEASTDDFTCYKCKSAQKNDPTINPKRCSYYQLQTRSSDEPMTTFVTCLNCSARWKC